MDPPTTTCEASPAAAAAQLCRALACAPADEMTGTTGACGRLGEASCGFSVSPHPSVCRRLGELKAALREIQHRRANRLGQPVGRRRRGGERNVGAHATQSRLQQRHHPRLVVDERGRGPGGLRRRRQPGDPAGDGGSHRDDVHRRGGERHQNRQRVARVGEGRGLGSAVAPDKVKSAATAPTTSRTSSKTASGSASSSISNTSRPSEPSTWASATPGIRRTGSSTTAACSCQRGNGSSGSRSKCTRRPLCQRTGGST